LAKVLEGKPVRKFLKEREPLIPHKKLIDLINIDGLLVGREAPPLPKGVSREEAIEVVAGSAWARGLAEGVCGGKYAGFEPGTTEFKTCVYNLRHRVAARVLGYTWVPPPMPPIRPSRRGR